MRKGKETFQNNLKLVHQYFVPFLTVVRNCAVAAMPMLINKTGQGSFSDPRGITPSTACVHMAKFSPTCLPTQSGFIHIAYWEESLAHTSSLTMPG